MKRRASTLLELLVTSALLCMLLVCLFVVFQAGSGAWLKGDARTSMLQAIQVAMAKLQRESERSIYDSFSYTPAGDAISFLSPQDDSGRFCYDPTTGKPGWQRFLVWYFQPTARSLCLAQLPVVGTPQETKPTPIEQFGAAQPLGTYATGGSVVANGLDACTFNVTDDKLLVVSLEARKTLRSGKVEVISVNSTIDWRN